MTPTKGGIQGELQGPPTGIAGVESLLFDAGCPGQMVQLEITGRDLEASAPAALAKLPAFSAALTAVPRRDFPFSMQIATRLFESRYSPCPCAFLFIYPRAPNLISLRSTGTMST